MAADESEVQPSAGTGEFSMPGQIDGRFEKFADFVEHYSGLISLKGIFCASKEPEPVGSQLVVDFRLADGFRLFNALGEVAWIGTPNEPVLLNGQAVSGMGIRFQALDAKGRNLIIRVLDEHVNIGGEPFDVETIPPVAMLDIPGVAAQSEPPIEQATDQQAEAEQLTAEPELQLEADEPALGFEEEIELVDEDQLEEIFASEPAAAKERAVSSLAIEQQLAELASEAPAANDDPAALEETADGALIAGEELAERLDSLNEETGIGEAGGLGQETLESLLDEPAVGSEKAALGKPDELDHFELELELEEDGEAAQIESLETATEAPQIHRLSGEEITPDPPADLHWGEEIPGLESELAATLPPTEVPPQPAAEPIDEINATAPAAEFALEALDPDPAAADPWTAAPVAAERPMTFGSEASKQRIEDSIVEPGAKPIPPRPSSGELSVPATEAHESPLEETQDSYVAWRPEGYEEGGLVGGVAQRAKSARPQLLALLLLLSLLAVGWFYRGALMELVGVRDTPEPRASVVQSDVATTELAPPGEDSSTAASANPTTLANGETAADETAEAGADEVTDSASLAEAEEDTGEVLASNDGGTALAAAIQPASDSAPAAPAPAAPAPADPVAESQRGDAVQGPPASMIDSITWAQESGRTVVRLTANGGFGSANLKLSRFRSRVRPRDLLVLSNIVQPYREGTIRIGNSELERIRVGFHPERDPDELHVVFDLVSEQVTTSAPRVNGSELEITFSRQ